MTALREPGAHSDNARRVLVVDDEQTIAEVVSRYLERAGYETRQAFAGPDAVAAVEAWDPDLVVLDVMLPGFDGLEVMGRIQESRADRDLDEYRPAVILLTARGEEPDRITGLRRGADDYVVKPFSPAELVARVDAVLRRPARAEGAGAPAPAPIKIGDLVIDPSCRAVQIEGRDVSLTALEFDLLLHLASHPGRVFTRDQLMERVWNSPFFTDTSTVTVHVGRLRGKIEPDPRRPRYIQTARGRRLPLLQNTTTIGDGGRTMRRGLVASILACVTGGVVVKVALDTHAALETFSLMLGVSMLALGVALVARHERRQIGTLGHQLALAVGIAVGAILAAVGVAAGLMFISGEDALLVSVMAGVVAVVGLQVAALLTTPIVEDITRLRDRLRAVGVGDRRADLTTNGSDELAELVAEANAMIARLAEEERGRTAAEDARQRLIIAVSHDLRTPLTSLRLMTEAIDDEIATGPTRARYLRDMQTHVAALSALVDDLFDLSRLQAGEATLAIEPADIGALADETVGALLATAAIRDVTLSCRADRIGHQLLVAEIDRERIRRVLMNLIDNAIRHSPPGGMVSTHVTRVDATIEVQVSDEGSGIPEAERAHVFEAFFRGGPDASRSGEGAGLGLAISRAIIESHGGSMWLAEAHRGTRVCFAIPAPALFGAKVPGRTGTVVYPQI